jgi:molecular chaperone HtpG
MTDYIFGVNILENLTTGMYKDSKVIYREYIQNACDQIDKAIEQNILSPENGQIEIWLDCKNKKVTIKDNATGIKKDNFQRVLCSIADSEKKIGEDKGFRGIGRLCGLAYCKELIFKSKAKNEDIISIMKCDAAKMRKLISEHQKGNKKTIQEVLEAINEFSSEKSDNKEEHFFQVELININDTNKDLLDSQKVKNYLSFTAPVPYQNTFIYRDKIYKYAKSNNIKIDEYNILLNGEQIFKKYSADLKESNGKKCDEIFDIDFKEFKDEDDKLIAWLWYGISSFKGVISENNEMRGLRLRKANIQIGNEKTLQDFFKESRGNNYFVGELFALSKNLIPNSQRNYFIENEDREIFKNKTQEFFKDTLHKIYYIASDINSAYDKKLTYDKAAIAPKQEFIDNADKEKQENELTNKKNKSEEADNKIDRQKQKYQNNETIKKIIDRAEKNYHSNKPQGKSNEGKTPTTAKPFTQTLPKLDRKQRKLVSTILAIVQEFTDKNTFEEIKDKVSEEFK